MRTTKQATRQSDFVSNTIIGKINANPRKYAESLSTHALEVILRKFSNIYYNTHEAIITDEEFDTMKQVLESKDPDNIFLIEVGAPVKGTKVRLPCPMPSLGKIKGGDQIAIEKWLSSYPGPYEVSDKLDGTSGELYKDNKGKLHMYTRGNGEYGKDISHLIQYLISDKVKVDLLPNNICIRGEIIISKENFAKIASIMTNARSAANGLVNSKTVRPDIMNISDFVCYQVLQPAMPKHEQTQLLKQYGFNVVHYNTYNTLSSEKLLKHLMERKNKSPYEIDGIVVFDSSSTYDVTLKLPDYAFAFKAVLGDYVERTTVVDVLWAPSMDGYLKPRVKIQSVNIGGTTVEYATGINAKYIIDNNIGPGAIIEITKGGEVIPKIHSIIKGTAPKLPNVPFKWTKNKVDIILKDIHGVQSDEVIIKRINHFLSTLGIKFIGLGIITKIVEHGYDSIPKLLSARSSDLIKIEGIGENLVNKIYDSINDTLQHTTLPIFMGASHVFGRNLGVTKLKDVITKYPNIMNETWDKETMIQKISDVKGFSKLLAERFVENYDAFIVFFNDINNIIDISYLKKKSIKPKTTNSKDPLFANKKIIFTGFRDNDLKQIIEDNGGKVTDSIPKKNQNGIEIIVVSSGNDNNSSKIIQAHELGIKIIQKEEFIKLYIG